MRTLLLVLGTALMGFGIGYVTGKDISRSNTKVRSLVVKRDVTQDSIEKRALSIDKECYSQADVEYIIFGESQE